MTQVYLNGEFIPLTEAKISVMDRGFLFGDGVYEVVPCYDRRPFRLADHLRRLQHSLDGIRLANPHADTSWAALIERIAAASEWSDTGVYVHITRGPGPRDHAFPAEPRPSVFIMPLPLAVPPAAQVEAGVAALTAEDNRWGRCDLKTTSLLANVLLRQLSVDAGCAETLLLRDGWLTEGSASSVFVVRDGVLLAPPESPRVLPGITYEVVLELAAKAAIPSSIRPIAEAELRAADEIWITSSTKEILAVTRLDGQAVGRGQPGPRFRQLHAAYQTYKRKVMRAGAAESQP